MSEVSVLRHGWNRASTVSATVSDLEVSNAFGKLGDRFAEAVAAEMVGKIADELLKTVRPAMIAAFHAAMDRVLDIPEAKP